MQASLAKFPSSRTISKIVSFSSQLHALLAFPYYTNTTLHNAGMQIGTRRTMALYRRMLFQHPHNNCNDANRRQTACLQYNVRNLCTNTKIAFPLKLKFQHRDLHISRSIVLNGSAWFCQSCSIASKLRSKKATAKEAQNKNGCHRVSMAKNIDTTQKLTPKNHPQRFYVTTLFAHFLDRNRHTRTFSRLTFGYRNSLAKH